MYGVLSVQSIISLPGSIYSSQDKQIACKVKPKQTKKQKQRNVQMWPGINVLKHRDATLRQPSWLSDASNQPWLVSL